MHRQRHLGEFKIEIRILEESRLSLNTKLGSGLTRSKDKDFKLKTKRR